MSRLAARQSPLGTIAQTLPRLGRVLRNLRPTWHLDSLEALDDAFVARHAIRAILWDVDGTLTTFHGPEVAPPARRFLALCRHPGLRIHLQADQFAGSSGRIVEAEVGTRHATATERLVRQEG